VTATALVTGGSGGLGRAIVGRLAEQWRVVVLDIVSPPSDLGSTEYATVDVCDAASVQRAVDELTRDAHSTALVNCAGVGPSYRSAVDLDPRAFHRAVDVNVVGALNSCRAVAPVMRARGKGRIVNISSVTAQGGWRWRTEYAASKAALESLTASLAVELGAQGITVNCVSPGHVKTAMTADSAIAWDALVARTALRRLVTPEEVADAVSFLVSDRASGITGTVLRVDAGYLANQLVVSDA